jgi:hypothetical protein
MDPVELLAGLVLPSGDTWGSVATDWQWSDVRKILDQSADAAPYHYLTRPRGGSKTTDLAGVAVAALLTQLPPGSRSYAVASDRDQGRLIVDSVQGFREQTPGLAGALSVDSFKVTSTKSRASLEVLAADSASAWGLRPHLLVVDEIAQWKSTREPQRLWEALHSATGKQPGARMVVCTSSGDPAHWSYRVLEHARASVRWRTSEVPGPLPWATEEFLAEQRGLLPDWQYVRLHLNDWMASDDRLVDLGNLRACVTLDGPLVAKPGTKYVIAVDVGLKNDRSVGVVAHLEGHTPPERSTAESSRFEGEQAVIARRMLELGLWSRERFESRLAEDAAFTAKMGLLGPVVDLAAGMSSEALKSLAKDSQKYIEDVASAFASYGDIVSKLGQTEATKREIEGFYAFATTGAKRFSTDIRTAITAGYDPNLISRILQAGPEQAGPLLRSLVSNHSTELQGMVNDSEKALQEISTQAAEMARLTNKAVTNSNDELTRDLSKAMAISQNILSNGGKAAVGALTKQLGIGALEVYAIAKEFGINLGLGINPLLTAIGATAVHVGGRGNARTGAVPKAEGGYILGPDTRRDSVPAMLMPGEVVVKRDSVKRFGVGPMLDLNAGRVPRGWHVPGYASGGFVSAADVPRPPDVSRYGTGVGYAGGQTMGYEYRQVIDFVKKNALAGPVASGAIQQLAQQMLAARGWASQWGPFAKLVAGESGWNVHARNASSGAYGLPQSLPGSKMASAGPDWRDNAATQLRWMLDYIAGRYHDPANAYATWLGRKPHWYAHGGRVDSVPAMLTPGEVVLNRASVGRFGAGNLMSLNSGRVPAGWSVPGFAKGGYVADGMRLPGGATQPTVIMQPPIIHSHTHVYIDGQEFKQLARTEAKAEVEHNNRRIIVELRTGHI